MKKTPLRVLVTSVGGRAVGHQIVHALQRLAERYTIVVTDADAFSFGGSIWCRTGTSCLMAQPRNTRQRSRAW
jgi:hypothetical protein